jgi:hypothetical protein
MGRNTHTLLALVAFFAPTLCAAAGSAAIVAQDSYETSSGVSFGGTSGSGLGPHTSLSGSGGIFFQSGSRKIDGDGSLGMFSNGSFEAVGRSVTDTSAFSSNTTAVFDISLRFDIPNSNSALKGFNLKTGLGTQFGDNELISVGMTSANNNALLITGSTLQTLTFTGNPDSDIRGDIIDVDVSWDILTGGYKVLAAMRGQAAVSLSGSLENPGSYIPGAIAFAHGDVGGSGNDVMFDNVVLSAVPESTAFCFGGLSCGIVGLAWCCRRLSKTLLSRSAA